MEQQPHRSCVRTKSKQKQNQVTSHSNWPRVLLFDLAHKQSNDIIKGWLHYLTSEPKGRFLVNNILFGSAWSLVMMQIQFSLIKKSKDWTSRHSLNSQPPTSDNISFLPYPPHPPHIPLKWTSYVYYPLSSHEKNWTYILHSDLEEIRQILWRINILFLKNSYIIYLDAVLMTTEHCITFIVSSFRVSEA